MNEQLPDSITTLEELTPHAPPGKLLTYFNLLRNFMEKSTVENTSKKQRNRKPGKPKNGRRKRSSRNVTGATSSSSLTIEEYSKVHAVSATQIWADIKAGKLIAKEVNGKIIIFNSKPNYENSSTEGRKVKGASFNELSASRQRTENTRGGATSYVAQERPGKLPKLPSLPIPSRGSRQAEISLLLDHLSIAKEENQEILKLAQKSLAQVKDVTNQIIASKDEVIAAKEEKIKALEQRLALADEKLVKVQRELEDEQILTKILSEQGKT